MNLGGFQRPLAPPKPSPGQALERHAITIHRRGAGPRIYTRPSNTGRNHAFTDDLLGPHLLGEFIRGQPTQLWISKDGVLLSSRNHFHCLPAALNPHALVWHHFVPENPSLI